MGVRDNAISIFEEQRALTDDEMQAYKDMLRRKEAITQLKIIATNMVGKLAETHDEREAKIIRKQIDVLDMGIDALKRIRFAKWIKRDKWLYCSACDGGGWGLGAVTYEWQYCPLCGAKIGE